MSFDGVETASSPSIKAIEIMSKPRRGLIKSPRGKRDVSRGSKLTGRPMEERKKTGDSQHA